MEICFEVHTVFGGKAIKSNVAYYSVRDAYLKGYLKRIIVTDYEDTNVSSEIIIKPVPFERTINSLLYRLYKYTPFDIPTRIISERLFDIGASRKIPECDLFYLQPPIFVRSMEKAISNGSITAVRDSTANFYHNLNIIKSENILYGIKDLPFDFLKNVKYYDKGIRLSDWIFSCSEYSKKTQIEQGIPEEKIVVAGQGVDIKRFSPPKKPKDINFRGIYVGNTLPVKGLRYLFDAWNNFAKKNQELILCGQIDYCVKQLFAKYKNKINMKTMGFVDPTEYYKNASILIHPSLTEGFEKVTMEAMSSGLPIITTTNTGAAGIIKDGREGFVVPIRDPKALEKYIIYFYENPSEVKRMGRNARRLAERYDWDNFSKKMCKLFEMAYESGRMK